jgi:D-xylose transport system ATP-binding protein
MSSPSTNRVPLLEMRGIGKSFPGVRALDGVTFNLQAGELHALVGENGAGKSTLMKVLAGAYPYPQYEGEIFLDGELQRFYSVRSSSQAGIAVVFQELSLVPEMSVAENIRLGREPRRAGVVQSEQMYAQAAKLLADLHLKFDVRQSVAELGIGQQQMVEIAKALSQDAKVLVLDEPTAALTDAEAEHLFTILQKLRDRGIGLIYISHRLEEVFKLSGRITVLRDGKTVDTQPTRELDEPRVIAKMVGREVTQLFPPAARSGTEEVLTVRGLSAERPDRPGTFALRDIHFSARSGEVLAIAGLMGAGRTELLMSIFGCYPGAVTGEIRIDGHVVTIQRPSDSIAHGVGLVTEDRKRSGLVVEHSVLQNMTLAALPTICGGFLTNQPREMAAGQSMVQSLRIKTASLFTEVGTLSGGNQQKVVLSKWLLTKPKVLLLDEPTRGIDVGAKQEIYAEIDRLARSGMAVVMVSSELPEVLGLADRILVLRDGQIAGEFSAADATPEAIMACATGQGAPA